MTQATASRVKRAQGRALVKFHSVPFAVNIGECSPAIVIRRVDEHGNPAEPKQPMIVTLNSDSASGTFSLDEDFSSANEIQQITINSGESDAVFYYRDYEAGTPTISISRNDLEDEQTETIRKAIVHAKAYDVPAAIYGTSPTSFTGTVTGLLPSDSVTQVGFACPGSPRDVGSYRIEPTITGAGWQGKYIFRPVFGTLTINPSPLSADDPSQAITFGDPIPTLTGKPRGIQYQDPITVTYACQATSTSSPGNYPITATFDDGGSRKLKNYIDQVGPMFLTINSASAQPSPQPIVNVFAFFTEAVPGTPSQQIPLSGVNLELSVAGKTATACTSPKGIASITAPVPLSHAEVGTLHVPQSHQLGAVYLRSTAKGPTYLQLDPNQPSLSLQLEYEKAPGELWLDATVHGKRLGGVTLSLFPSSPASDRPVRSIVTSASAPTVVTGLPEGGYNVFVSSEPLQHEGHAIELECPQDGWLNATIAAGQRVPLPDEAIRFRPSVGRIAAVVSDAGTGRGLAQVPVTVTRHEGHRGQPVTRYTDGNGEVPFPNLVPGEYTVQLAQLEITLQGVNWVPKGDTSHRVTVRPSATTAAPEFQMQHDIPLIEGEILDEDGNPFPFAEVVIYYPSGDKILDTVIADQQGKFTRVVPSKGVWYVGPKQDSAGATTTKTPVTVRSPGHVVATFRRGIAGAPSAPASGKQVREAFTDLAAYPILTEEIGFPPAPVSMPSAGGVVAPAPGTTALGQIALKAVADVLGWKIKSDDPKGFVGALNQAFTITEVEGHIESKWVPRNYAVQSDLSGGLTGAQASIYSRAQDALDKSLPLLNGLYALDPAADPEDVEALREVVRDQMTQLVNELGYAGGPRVARVNQYFFLLLGPPLALSMSATNPIQFDPDKIQGTLGNLRDVYGIATLPKGKPNRLVNTVDDEQDTTNFRVLSDYTTSLAQSWLSNLQFFVLPTTPSVTSTPFLGTQLVLISRQLSVTSELVDDARFALDSVFIGASERQTLLITFNPSTGFAPIFLEDLLSWIQRLVNEEAPTVIQSAGKFGVYQIVQVLTQLQLMLAASLNPASTTDIPAGYFTPRVQRALTALGDQVQELINLATPVGTPKLVSVA